MDQSDKTDFFRTFLKAHGFATVSTVGADQKPESAIMEYFILDEGLDLVFRTQTDFRKYENLKNNPHVAIQISTSETKTLQYEGVAQEIRMEDLPQGDQVEIASSSISGRVIYEEAKGVYFRVKPTWIRYTDVTKRPWEQVEMKEF